MSKYLLFIHKKRQTCYQLAWFAGSTWHVFFLFLFWRLFYKSRDKWRGIIVCCILKLKHSWSFYSVLSKSFVHLLKDFNIKSMSKKKRKSNLHLIYPKIVTADFSHSEQALSYVQYLEKRIKSTNILTLISNLFIF